MDYYSPKHVERLIENKVWSQEFSASCWFVYVLYDDAWCIQRQKRNYEL